MNLNYTKEKKLAKKMFSKALWNPKISVKTIRANYTTLLAKEKMPSNVEIKEIDTKLTKGDFYTAEYARGNKLILYIHGGSFISGSRLAYKSLAASLAHATGSRLFLPEYRLAPEYPFPTGLQDVYSSYEWLLKESFSPKDIIIAGDGSGANIGIALVHNLINRNLPKPLAVINISPWTDLTCSNIGSSVKKKTDYLFTKEMLENIAVQYTFSSNIENPQVSPYFGDFTNFPPLYIQCGSEEILLDDAKALAKKVKNSGGDVFLDIEPGMWHLFQALDSISPVAHLALERIGLWVTKVSKRG